MGHNGRWTIWQYALATVGAVLHFASAIGAGVLIGGLTAAWFAGTDAVPIGVVLGCGVACGVLLGLPHFAIAAARRTTIEVVFGAGSLTLFLPVLVPELPAPAVLLFLLSITIAGGFTAAAWLSVVEPPNCWLARRGRGSSAALTLLLLGFGVGTAVSFVTLRVNDSRFWWVLSALGLITAYWFRSRFLGRRFRLRISQVVWLGCVGALAMGVLLVAESLVSRPPAPDDLALRTRWLVPIDARLAVAWTRSGLPAMFGVAFALIYGIVVGLQAVRNGVTGRQLRAHYGGVTQLVPTACGRRFLSCSEDGSVIVWDAESLTVVARSDDPSRHVRVAGTPDESSLVLIVSDHYDRAEPVLTVWDVESQTVLAERDVSDVDLWCLIILHKGGEEFSVVLDDEDAPLVRREIRTGREVGRWSLGLTPEQRTGMMLLSCDGDGQRLWLLDGTGVVREYDLKARRLVRTFESRGRTQVTTACLTQSESVLFGDASGLLYEFAGASAEPTVSGPAGNAAQPFAPLLLIVESAGGRLITLATGPLRLATWRRDGGSENGWRPGVVTPIETRMQSVLVFPDINRMFIGTETGRLATVALTDDLNPAAQPSRFGEGEAGAPGPEADGAGHRS